MAVSDEQFKVILGRLVNESLRKIRPMAPLPDAQVFQDLIQSVEFLASKVEELSGAQQGNAQGATPFTPLKDSRSQTPSKERPGSP